MPKSRLPSPAFVVSIIALVMATAGTATAAKVLIKSSSQIKNNVVTGADVRNGSIDTRDLKDDAVDDEKIRNGSIGPDELTPSARQALTGATVGAFEAFRKSGPSGQTANTMQRVITFNNLEPGVYAIFGKTVITITENNEGLLQEGRSASALCVLDAGGDRDESRTLLGGPGTTAPTELHMQITRTFSRTGQVTIDCATTTGQWAASDSSIIALKVARAPRTAVEG